MENTLEKHRRQDDSRYLARVRELPCCACGSDPGSVTSDHWVTVIEAHHRTGAGVALKADDHDTMPLCLRCHRDFHDSRGAFRDWAKDRKRNWQRAMVAATMALLDRRERDELADIGRIAVSLAIDGGECLTCIPTRSDRHSDDCPVGQWLNAHPDYRAEARADV